jgi:hypothetical protein
MMKARFRREGRSYPHRLLPLLIAVLVLLSVLCSGAVSDASAACQDVERKDGDHSSSAASSFFLHNRAHQDDFTAIANIAPPLRHGETHNDRDRIDALLRHYWSSSSSSSSSRSTGGGATTRSSRSGYYHHDRSTTPPPPTIGTSGNQTTKTSDTGGGGVEFTYGELTPLGVRQLAHWMKLSQDGTTDRERQRPVTFFDVGSGVGKLVVQMYWENLHVDGYSFRAVGIEYCTIRHGIAAKVWNEIVAQRSTTFMGGSCFVKEKEEDDDVSDACVRRNDQEEDQQRQHRERPVVEFRHQDARSADFTAATHVFLASLCFPRDLTDAIARQLINADAAPHLQVVAALSTLRPFQNDTTSWTETTHEIQTSWGRARVHVYIRHNAPSSS